MINDFLENQLYATIPLRATQFGHLEVNGFINDIPALFLLDTGAASTVIDISFAQENGLQLMETTITGGGVGTSELLIYQLAPATLQLSNVWLEEATIFAADLQHVKQSLLDKGETSLPCGVLGADLLINHEAVIHYGEMLLYLKH